LFRLLSKSTFFFYVFNKMAFEFGRRRRSSKRSSKGEEDVKVVKVSRRRSRRGSRRGRKSRRGSRRGRKSRRGSKRGRKSRRGGNRSVLKKVMAIKWGQGVSLGDAWKIYRGEKSSGKSSKRSRRSRRSKKAFGVQIIPGF
jgi:hypothetical protein